MKKKELLEHIRALQQRVTLLEMQMSGKQDREIFIPSVWTTTGTYFHEYPFPWHSTSPAPCKKCGQLGPTYTITCSAPSPEESAAAICSTCVDNKCQCEL